MRWAASRRLRPDVADARLEVTDTLGRRLVRLEKPIFAIGRRTESDLRVVSSDVSRDHAEIVRDGDGYIVRDRSSRYGTFVNGDGVKERALAHGDRIRLGRSGGAELVFLVDEAASSVGYSRTAGSCRTDRPAGAQNGDWMLRPRRHDRRLRAGFA